MKIMHLWPRAVIVTLILTGMAGCSQKAEQKVQKMSTELEMEHQIDLGTILDTTVPIQLFIPVKNRSDRKVTIFKLTKDCSCTAVSIDKLSLAPGETAHIRVSSNLTGKLNPYRGEIVMESDATEKIDEILIQGTITGQIRIRPLQSVVGLGEKYAPASFTVFSDDQNGKWKYEGFTSDDPNLRVELSPKSASPTTSTYAGTVEIPSEEARKGYAGYRQAVVKLRFVNERLGKSLQLNHMVELVTRQNVTTDPAQVTFGNGVKDQKRVILVQSGDAINIDAATCGSACVRSTVERIDAKTLKVELIFLPAAGEVLPQNLACELQSNGKTLASIPINIVSVQ